MTDPRRQLEVLEMTPERKARMLSASKRVIAVLEPLPLVERFVILDLARTSLEKSCGVTVHGTALLKDSQIGET